MLTYQDAKNKNETDFEVYDAIVYGGWAMAGNVVNSKWFLSKAPKWRGKKLALFCVGASPVDFPDVEEALKNMVSDEQREYIKAFYCPGGLDYSKMNTASKLAMKALLHTLKHKKNPEPKDTEMASWIDHSYDISDEKYLDPIIEYLMN